MAARDLYEKDFYKILGVSKNAPADEIKKKYRSLARELHPDKNKGDVKLEEQFKAVSEAYDILGDDKKRAEYDEARSLYEKGGMRAPMGGGNYQGGDFGDIFGGGRGRSGPQRGSDLRYTLDISLEDAVKGATVEIRVPSLNACDTCDGSGASPGSSPTTCGTCGGVGQVRMQQGLFQVQQTCPTCRGRGKSISDPCNSCHGQGRVETTKTLSVKVPPGVDTGDRIRLSGEGEAGPEGGPSGDLFVQMSVRQHAIFERDGKNLYCEVPITFADAALGGELDVPTLDGRVKLKITAETQTGKLFRLRGKGVKPVRGGATGDLLCRVVVETPVSLTKRQRELLEAYAKEAGEAVSGPGLREKLGL